MKTILSLLLILALAMSAQAVDRITAIITVTNTPADGNTLTVNGDVRTWKTTVVTPATQISITNVVGYSATNLFNQASATLYAGPLGLSYSATNAVQLVANSGNALVVTASGSWCSIVMSTQAVTSMFSVRVPMAGEPTASVRTNFSSLLAQAISDYSTTSVAAAAVALSNHVNNATAQTIGGDKTFTGAITATGANIISNSTQRIDGGSISNVTLSASTVTTTNVIMQTGLWGGSYVYPTNFYNFRNPDNSLGGFSASVNSAGFIFSGPLQVGNLVAQSTLFTGTGNLMGSQIVTGDDSILNYGLANTFYTLQTNGTVQNLTEYGGTLNGTNTFTGQVAFTRKNLSSLANGANSISASTNLYLKVSGPSGAFSIAGIAGGTDGRLIIIQNSTGQTLTVANESGSESTAANRILCSTGADIAVTGNPGAVTLIYDSAASRWLMISHN